MKVLNKTKNTIKLTDVNTIIPYKGECIDIDEDLFYKSKELQSLCLNRDIEIVHSDNKFQEQFMNLSNEKIESQILPSVHVSGHFLSNTGYAKANRNLVYALAQSGIDVSINLSSNSMGNMYEQELEKISRYHGEADSNSIHIDSMIPSFSEPKSSIYNVLNTTIESASIPSQFVDAAERYDEIWVPSEFCKEVFIEYGLTKPVHVIPNAVNPNFYNPKANKANFSQELKKFVFVAVGSWTWRKGFDTLLKAYRQEFTSDDDVTLLLVTQYMNTKQDEVDDLIKSLDNNEPSIARIGLDLQEYEMPQIYKACDCFILLSRGEGFCLPYVEAAMMGLPVIATNWSGHSMYLNDNNSLLVDIDELYRIDEGTTGIHYWDGELFPCLSDDKVVRDVQQKMRDIYEQPNEYKAIAERLQNDVQKFTICEVGSIAKQRIKEISKCIKRF